MDLALDSDYEEEREKDMEKLEYTYEGRTYHIDKELAERYAWKTEGARLGEERFRAEVDMALKMARVQLENEGASLDNLSVTERAKEIMQDNIELSGGWMDADDREFRANNRL